MNSSDHINTKLSTLPSLIDFRKVGNLLIFRENVLALRPKSVYEVEMTIYVHLTRINLDRKMFMLE